MTVGSDVMPFEHREIDADAVIDDVMLNIKLALEEYMDRTGKTLWETACTMGSLPTSMECAMKGSYSWRMEELIRGMSRLGIPVKITIGEECIENE